MKHRRCTITLFLAFILAFIHTNIYGKALTKSVHLNDTSDFLIAHWDFSRESMDENGIDLIDLSRNSFVGSLMGDAWLQTMGETAQIETLHMGDGEGYFDLGTELGEAIYGLENYTISCYFRMDEDLDSAGFNNYIIWSFANAILPDSSQNGYMYASLNNLKHRVSPDSIKNETGLITDINATTDHWHHLAYSQTDTTGKLYLDGELIRSGTVKLSPADALKKEGFEGSRFNWLGRFGERFSKNLMLYDFRIYAKGLDESELIGTNPEGIGLNVIQNIGILDEAYNDHCDCYAYKIWKEAENLESAILKYLTPDDTLPTKGILYPNISISWASTSALVNSNGVVSLPDYLPKNVQGLDVKLTATLSYRDVVYEVPYDAFIPANPETQYKSDTLICFNFGSDHINGPLVTDASEKHFEGTLMKGAEVKQLWDGTDTYGVLNLWKDSSYFDMGTEVGKVIYALKGNFSFSVYFYIDESKTTLEEPGNHLFTFSNSDASDQDQNGYLFASAPYASYTVADADEWSSSHYGTTNLPHAVETGVWHHFVYNQADTLGIVYLDGEPKDTAVIKKGPSKILPYEAHSGTDYNFLGRSNFSMDQYLNKAMLYDFMLLGRTLTDEEIADLSKLTNNLTAAYLISLSNRQPIKHSEYTIDSSIPGVIHIKSLTGSEDIRVYNILGKQMPVNDKTRVYVDPGIYIVRINQTIQKVLMR